MSGRRRIAGASHRPDVRSYSVTHPPGAVQLPTEPGWDVVLYARTGALGAVASDAEWVVPSGRALCVGGVAAVQVRTRVRTAVRALYLRAGLGVVPPGVRVAALHPFGRELLLHMVAVCPLDRGEPTAAALVTLLADELARAPEGPLRLPRPDDPRAVALADAVSARPDRPLDELVADVGASRRTLERIFAREVGLAPSAWQRRARVQAAIDLLAAGRSVTETAVAVGYATPSAFVAAFRAETGTTPSRMAGRR